MPAHIYARTGDYEQGATANVAAVKADLAYIERTGTQGSMYDMMYFTHNLHFLSQACAMEGNSKCALENVNRMVEHVAPEVKAMPMLEWFLAWQPLMMARFQQWDAILKLPSPDSALTMDTAAWHYARGVAFLSKRQGPQAQAELDALTTLAANTPADLPYGLNTAKNVLAVAIEVLAGKLAAANGDAPAAIAHYRKAVAAQDLLNYDEPPDWYYPVRETLGAALLAQGDAASAEGVFREDLARNPRNGRSLYGLHKSLQAQQHDAAAAWVQLQFNDAWTKADVQPNLAVY
jgi:tetratricopeptide (TPR) repeat protein